MERIELAVLYCLHTLRGVGSKTLWRIKADFGGFQNCWEADSSALGRSFLPSPVVEAIVDSRRNTEPLALLDNLRDDDIGICSVEDEDYPRLLQTIYDPPYVLYYRGNLKILDQMCIGIVGSRAATTYGKLQSRRFGNLLASQDITIISGMARGIDTEAHQGALEAGGKTAAVLGNGLNTIYPPENKQLHSIIGQKGLLLSEFSPPTHPEPGNFPVRNRTISGLCRGILVVEAKERSGALITADFALEQGRDVFAIPGPVSSPNSEGTNNLIKQGACLVSKIEDILGEYGMDDLNVSQTARQGELPLVLEGEQLLVWQCLSGEALHFDYLLGASDLNIGMLSSILLKLELKGIIRALPGNYYVKI